MINPCKLLWTAVCIWQVSSIWISTSVRKRSREDPKILTVFTVWLPARDKVTARVLKDSLPITIAEITNLVNTSFSSNKFTQVWKLAEVIPILKSGDPDELSNTRPISLLPIMSKACERAVHSQFQNCKVVIGDSTRPKLLYFISRMKSLRTWTTKTYPWSSF